MNPVHLQPDAFVDISEAAAWYKSQRWGLGEESIFEVDAAIKKAAEHPQAYELKFQEARRVLLHRFPYSVYFLFEDGVVEVFAVLHQHRAPETWQSRLS